eukprot:GFYU01006816.1.p1 GENE.GFYU01006816.1~~GFYU01006816.1.p1  ORF type:complete len:244 (+),score=54.16 GFYU01006816.1:63-794(+)
MPKFIAATAALSAALLSTTVPVSVSAALNAAGGDLVRGDVAPVSVSVGTNTCGARGSPQTPRGLDTYADMSDSEFVSALGGDWHVLSTINWFMKGWSCFKGHLVVDTQATDNNSSSSCVTANWSFKVPLLGEQSMTDQLCMEPESEGTQRLEGLVLKSLSMPSWLRKLLSEEAREVRVLAVSPRTSQGEIDWIVLFDCANWITPYGELFVMSRTETLPEDQLNHIHEIVKANGVSDFNLLGTC